MGLGEVLGGRFDQKLWDVGARWQCGDEEHGGGYIFWLEDLGLVFVADLDRASVQDGCIDFPWAKIGGTNAVVLFFLRQHAG